MNRQLRSDRHKTVLYTAVTLAVVAVALTIWYNRSTLASSWTDATTRQPTSYTELSLDNYAQLPNTITANIPVHFNFHIANHTGKVTTYPYVITLTNSVSTTVIASTFVTVENGDITVIPVSFTAQKANERNLITVTLTGRNEAVHFWSQS